RGKTPVFDAWSLIACAPWMFPCALGKSLADAGRLQQSYRPRQMARRVCRHSVHPIGSHIDLDVEVVVDACGLAAIEHRGRGLFFDHCGSVDDGAGLELAATEHRYRHCLACTEMSLPRFVRRRRA